MSASHMGNTVGHVRMSRCEGREWFRLILAAVEGVVAYARRRGSCLCWTVQSVPTRLKSMEMRGLLHAELKLQNFKASTATEELRSKIVSSVLNVTPCLMCATCKSPMVHENSPA